ncbi:hypothetical protein F443_09151 [Phytophthora nicotianae P1569]|uniref:FYVE-type domain-containing protein n=1 Tax=Phytophthora nicotianae P1569 TaxID=1317065 RepID=V9F4N3_PHYNI|nr:hypothetical protein F443_09151 [Phytophthora nicotianae P1569]
MKFTLPDDVFPPVRLSRKHQGALIEEAETVVSETIAANESFLNQGAQFPDLQWRLVRIKEGLHVYRQRSTRLSTQAASRKRLGTDIEEETQVSSSSVNKCSIQDTVRRPSVSLMVLHGTMDGTLDDSMFGAFAATDDAWKWRSSHVNDRLDDARILSTVRGPTKNDPFRFLGIKWFAKEHPTVLTGILQRRDFLIMEATGLTTDANGEKIGYFLMHSVAIRGVPKLSELGILRGELSFCFILRQKGPGKVELYCRGFSDPRGEMMERVSVAIASEALICAAGVVDYAHIKKLRWLMKHKNAQNLGHSARETRPTHCESCNKNLTKFTLLPRTGKGSACQICQRVICTKCSVVKKMTVDVSDTGAVKQCSLRFCLACLLEAKEKSAWEIAQNCFEATTPEAVGTPGRVQLRCDGRSYSEYQRVGTRVYRQGEIATYFRMKPDSRGSVKKGNSRMNGRYQSFRGGRATHVESDACERHMYRDPSPSYGHVHSRGRCSERPKQSDKRFHTLI